MGLGKKSAAVTSSTLLIDLWHLKFNDFPGMNSFFRLYNGVNTDRMGVRFRCQFIFCFGLYVCEGPRGLSGYVLDVSDCEGVDFLTCEPGGPHVQGACLTSYANDVYVLHTVLSIPLRK